jgi:hypothetical protein
MTADEAAARVVSEYSVTLGRVRTEHSMGALREIVIKVFDQVIDEERAPEGETSDAGK